MKKQYLVASFIISSLLVPVLASAATADEIKAQIQSLLSQITALQAQLDTLTSDSSVTTTTSSNSCPNLYRTLSRGSRGSDVISLQQFLIAQGLLSSDSATGFFGGMTEGAVQKWQAQNSIISYGDAASTGYGRIGPATRKAMMCSAESEVDDLFLEDIFLEDLLDEGETDIPIGDIPITGSPDTSQAAAAAEQFNTPPFGYVGNVWANGTAHGWAYDPDEPDVAIAVHVYLDGKADGGVFLGTAKADKNRKDITEGKKSYNHWYSFAIPEEYKDGKQHTLYVYGIDSKGASLHNNTLLKNNPKTFKLVKITTLPPSCTLSASPESITQGNTSTLSWTSTDTTSGSINNGAGAMTPIASGSKSVSPTTSTLYTATVTGGGGTATCEANVDVTIGGDTQKPTVSLTAPSASSTVSGSVTISANASDNVGVTGVQFKVDGANVGTLDTTAPYSIVWDSTTVPDGSHNIRAVARDAAGNSQWSALRSVTVSNGASSPFSLIHDSTFQNGIDVRSPDRNASCGAYSIGTLRPFGSMSATPEWLLGQWYGRYPITATTTKTILPDGSVEYENTGKRVVFGPGNRFVLGVKSVDRGPWEIPCKNFYSTKQKTFFGIGPITESGNLVPLTQIQSVQFKLSFRLTKAQGNAGSGEAAHIQANLRLRNVNPASPGYREWMYFIIKLYTSQERYPSANVGVDKNGAMLYKLASSNFYSGTSWDKQWISIDKDLRSFFQNGLDTGVSRRYLQSSNLNDYAVVAESPHWEVNAPMDVEMEFKDYDIILTPKPGVVLGASTTQNPSFIDSIRASFSNALGMVGSVLQSLLRIAD